MKRARLGKRWKERALTVELSCLQGVSQDQRRFKSEGSGLSSVVPKFGWASESLGKLKNNNSNKPKQNKFLAPLQISTILGDGIENVNFLKSFVILMLHLRLGALMNPWLDFPSSVQMRIQIEPSLGCSGSHSLTFFFF